MQHRKSHLAHYLGLSAMLLAGTGAHSATVRDLALTGSAAPGQVAVGADVTYTFVAVNEGPTNAKSLVLIAQLPGNAALKSASPSCKFANRQARKKNKLTCKAPRLLPGENVSWTLSATATAEGDLSATGTLKFHKADTNPLNNSTTAVAGTGTATTNRAPIANGLSHSADSTTAPNLELQLVAGDADNDPLTYELLAPASGTGYTLAQVNPATGRLSVSLVSGFQGQITLPFRVSDGKTFSNEALVQIVVQSSGGGGTNRAPVASPLSQTADPAIPYLEVQLIASDADNDTLTFELLAGATGTGYTLAYVSPATGKLYMSLAPGFLGQITLPFRATDGKLFSNEAQIQIQVQAGSEDKGLGGQEIDPQRYAEFERLRLGSNLLGAPGKPPAEPPSVDLSPNFPTPGDQGQQGSCVGWATAYALKTYHEAVEMNWAPNTASRLFSPAYVYNQINGGQDGGSQIYDALDLMISQGAATLATMPYSDRDFRTQPGNSARTEAANFKAVRRGTLNGISDIKGALAQRRPVVLGIEVFDQFYQLKGPNSVYNSTSGSNTGQHGRHAVTAVGYDNTKFGGALRVINSWSTQWGDNGYFWLPYDMAPRVIFQAWTLEDGKNGNVPVNPDPAPPTPPGNLPDLQVQNWTADFDRSIGANGQLEWRVVNSGQGTAPSGVTVSLMLSTDQTINANDTYVVYEEIPFDLAPGETAFRSLADGNGIEFQIPSTIAPGNYFMAMVVDDLDRIKESDETNNVSPSNGVVQFSDTLSDLSVETWYANWDDFTGAGQLTYQVRNIGTQTIPAGWFLGLFLSQSEDLTNAYPLTLEQVPFSSPPQGGVERNFFNPVSFNLYFDINFRSIPPGFYYMALYADADNRIQESDELNNISYSWGYVAVGFDQFGAASTPSANGTPAADTSSAGAGTTRPSVAYNGKHLPEKIVQMRPVRISDEPGIGRTMEFLDTPPSGPTAMTAPPQGFQKTLHAGDPVVFPVVQEKAMPAAAEPQQ